MIWTWLRSCYSFRMRVYIGRHEYIVPARWFFTLPGARPFPFPHGAEASPWLKNYERNDEWGEVTPYPTDRDADYRRLLDRGLNPGYLGQRYVGEDQWFVDGELPGDILSGSPPPIQKLCLPPPPALRGGLVLGGTAFVTFTQGSASTGGLALGGSGRPFRGQVYVSVGGLALGGSAVATGPRGYRTVGGLALGGGAKAGAGAKSGGGLALGGTGNAPGPPFPGPTCPQAGVLALGVPVPPMPFAAGNFWWTIPLVGGQTYHVTASASSPLAPPLYWQVWTGTCNALVPVATDGYGSWPFVAPTTGTYLVQAQVLLGGAGTWQIGVFAGP